MADGLQEAPFVTDKFQNEYTDCETACFAARKRGHSSVQQQNRNQKILPRYLTERFAIALDQGTRDEARRVPQVMEICGNLASFLAADEPLLEGCWN